MNPRAAINDLTAFQAIPFNHLGTSPNALQNVFNFFAAFSATSDILSLLLFLVKYFFKYFCFILSLYAATSVILPEVSSFVKYYFQHIHKAEGG